MAALDVLEDLRSASAMHHIAGLYAFRHLPAQIADLSQAWLPLENFMSKVVCFGFTPMYATKRMQVVPKDWKTHSCIYPGPHPIGLMRCSLFLREECTILLF